MFLGLEGGEKLTEAVCLFEVCLMAGDADVKLSKHLLVKSGD